MIVFFVSDRGASCQGAEVLCAFVTLQDDDGSASSTELHRNLVLLSRIAHLHDLTEGFWEVVGPEGLHSFENQTKFHSLLLIKGKSKLGAFYVCENAHYLTDLNHVS